MELSTYGKALQFIIASQFEASEWSLVPNRSQGNLPTFSSSTPLVGHHPKEGVSDFSLAGGVRFQWNCDPAANHYSAKTP
jgi:hypothetical protein